MRKRIAVFTGEIAQEIQKRTITTIIKSANAYNYDVISFCSYGMYNEDMICADGEKAIIKLPDCSMFDGIIVMEDLFDIPNMPNELYKKIKETAKCPVVYLRTEREGCYSILLENVESMRTMTRHFIVDHKFTDICYMSGKRNTLDAEERLAGFVSVMREHNLEIKEHTIYHGDFWRNQGPQAVDWFLEGRDKFSYPQVIICANDYMALSICEELKKRGIRVPEDICVSGFDFIEEAKYAVPALTSLEVDFETMSRTAVDIIYKVNNGIEEEKIRKIPAKLVLNKSCGCGKKYENLTQVDLVQERYYKETNTKNLILSFIDYQNAFSQSEYMKVAYRYRSALKANNAYFMLLDKDYNKEDVENDNNFSKIAILNYIIKDKNNLESVDIKFPKYKIIPDEYWNCDEYNNLFAFPLHYKNIVLGYIVTDMPDINNWFDIYTQGYLMIIANTIQNSIVHEKTEQLKVMQDLVQKDGLTEIYNRRGFDTLLHEKYSNYQFDASNTFAYAFVDMDNLKMINDTYSHSEGDDAIKTIAKTIDGLLLDGEFCCRYGGDEFAAVLDTKVPNRIAQFKQDLAMKLEAESANREYELGASIGICEINEQTVYSLVECIQNADSRMYENKKARKRGRDF